MRVIALMNQKGGVGKTTTTASLGAALAEAGKRVCLIDLDPQAHLTINFGIEPAPAHTHAAASTSAPATSVPLSVYDVLADDRSLLEAMQTIDLSPGSTPSPASSSAGGVVGPGSTGSRPAPMRPTSQGSIALVPSSIDLAAAEVELVSMLGREQLLKKRLEAAVAAGARFDYVLMDCPPSLGLLTINALAAAGEVIIPMQPHFLALQGVGKLLETVTLVCKRMNPQLRVSGIVLTMWDGQARLSAEVVADLQHFLDNARGKPLPYADCRIFETRIRRNIKLAECPSFGKSILAYEPNSNGAADYRALAQEVIAMERRPADSRVAASPPRPQVQLNLPRSPAAPTRT